MEILFLTFLILLIAGGLGAFVYFFLKKKEQEYISESLNMSLFLVTMPKHKLNNEKTDSKEEKTLIGQMEQVFSNFLSLKKPSFLERMIYGPSRITLEIASQIGGKDICFYVAVPGYLESSFEKYVQGVYNRALVEKVPQDYTIFEPNGATAGCYLKLTEHSLFPINTYKNLDKDPLSSITNSLSKITANEGAAIQIVIRPSSTAWKKVGNKVLSKVKEGQSIKTAIFDSSKGFFVEVLEKLFEVVQGPSKKKENAGDQNKADEKTVNAIQAKIQKPIFETNIRILTSASTETRAKEILNHIKSSFSQFSLIVFNSFTTIELKDKSLKKLVYDFSFRNFDSYQKIDLNVEELTSLYHFPTYYLETPYIKSVKSGDTEPPINLPEKGLNLLGTVNFRGEEKGVKIANRKDRRRHFYFIGQTGTGKSGLLQEMIRWDIENGEGVGVIDPHGDLVENTLANIPKEREKDVVLFNPSDIERPVGLNMLECETLGQKDFAVQEMISIFYKLFPPEMMGPIFEHYMRNAMLAVMADKETPGTLVEVSRMFTDNVFMENTLRKVEDPMVKMFWLKEWKEQSAGGNKSEMMGYVISKIGRFVENSMMRNIIGQSHSGFSLTDIINNKKILLVNLSKGLVGEMNSSLLGLILVSKIQMAAMKRASIPEKERTDFYLYIDEFQNFTTDSISTILSEARKYHLNLILAHQYISQLKEEIKNAVLGNVGTIGSFRVGPDDSEFLEKQFKPNFSKFDLVNLDNFNLILKMMISNEVSKAFKVKTIDPKEGNLERVKNLKEMSRLKYGQSKSVVEKNISKRL